MLLQRYFCLCGGWVAAAAATPRLTLRALYLRLCLTCAYTYAMPHTTHTLHVITVVAVVVAAAATSRQGRTPGPVHVGLAEMMKLAEERAKAEASAKSEG